MGNSNEYMSDYMLGRYHGLMDEARRYLGGKCSMCAKTEALEMDHVDPSTKKFTISQGWSKDPAEFWAEVDKCQLLCREHHQAKTSEEKFVPHGGGKSGRNLCKCSPCRARKSEYMHEYGKAYRLKKKAALEASSQRTAGVTA